MTLDIHVHWQLSKQETRWLVSRDHIAVLDVVFEHLIDEGVAQDGAQRK